MTHRGGGRRDEPAEQTGDDEAAALSQQSRRDVGGQADAHDQHHHQPDLERVEDLVAIERAVGQQREDDEPDENEAEDRARVVLAEAGHQTVERLSTVQEDGNHAGGDDALGDEAGAERGAHREHQERRHLGGDPDRALVAPARRVDLAPGADADHDRDGEQRRRNEPSAESRREQRRDRSQQRDERERADAGDRAARPLSLQTDQESQPERDRQVGERR